MESAVARILHIIGVVWWIGGVTLVTTALLPMMVTMPDRTEGVRLFHAVEGRFARQARWLVALVGISGLYLAGSWERLTQPESWWLYPMMAVWGAFAILLLVLEPLLLRKHFLCLALNNPDGTLRRVLLAHRVLLGLSWIAIGCAVAGSHGMLG